MTDQPSDVAALAMNLLWGDAKSLEKLKPAVGDKIREIAITDNALVLTFARGSLEALNDCPAQRARIWDSGQSCCESRYMHCDDDLSKYVGARFLGAAVRPGPEEVVGGDGCKEQEFLLIWTSIGVLTVANYNEHNGYYGGFSIEASLSRYAEETNGSARVSDQG